MKIDTKIQQLSAGSRIRLIQVDGSAFGAPIMRIHPHSLEHTPAQVQEAITSGKELNARSIWWQGVEYDHCPCEITGLSADAEGEQAVPVFNVANLNGIVSALCREYADMARARVTIWDTFAEYLDAANFPEGNPEADPSAHFKWVFDIDARVAEDYTYVSFQLANPAAMELMIPTRQITDMCTWAFRGQYRTGNGCAYTGSAYFDKNGNPVTDPALDQCGGMRSDCQKRFGENNPLDFGGCPAAGLLTR